jgi:hypothetical protein
MILSAQRAPRDKAVTKKVNPAGDLPCLPLVQFFSPQQNPLVRRAVMHWQRYLSAFIFTRAPHDVSLDQVVLWCRVHNAWRRKSATTC